MFSCHLSLRWWGHLRNGSRSAVSWLPSSWCWTTVSGLNWWQLTWRANANKQEVMNLCQFYSFLHVSTDVGLSVWISFVDISLNPHLTCNWLQELYLLAVFCSHGVSRPPGGCPRTNTSCGPLWDYSWSVHSGACVLVLSQHLTGPGDQLLHL